MTAATAQGWLWRVLGLLLALAMLTAANGCSPQRSIEAAQLATDVAAGDEPSRFKRTRPEPRREDVGYEIEGRSSQGHLYLPGADDRALAGLVLVPGAAAEGRDDPRLIAFARSLARARFAVLVPEIANLRELKVRASDARKVADAVRHLASLVPDEGEGAEVGVVAISYAVGPAVLAAAEPDARDQVGYIVAVGGYYDLEAVITFFTTGYYRLGPEAPWRHREPNPYGKWVFLYSNSEIMSQPRDRRLLREMAERRLHDLDAAVADLAEGLTRDGRAVLALLENTRRDRVPELIAALPAEVREEIAALNLRRLDFSRVTAELLLIHGRDDAIIPYSESRKLAEARGEADSTLFLVDNLAHVDVGPGSLGDSLTFWRAAYRLLEERDAAPAPSPALGQAEALSSLSAAGRSPSRRKDWPGAAF